MIKQLCKLRLLIVVTVFVVAAANGMTTNAQTVTATVTCDNYWALYYGTSNSITSYSGQQGSYGGTPGPFTFNVPSGATYIYIVAWSDVRTAQGFLGNFQGLYGGLVRTGDAAWKVKPTNLRLSLPLAGPASNTFLTAIVGPLSTAAGNSAPWTPPIAGSPNSAAQFSSQLGAQKLWSPITSIDPIAKWMWYKGVLPCSSLPGSPLGPSCDHGEPLLFRLPVEVLQPCLKVTSTHLPCCLGKDALGNAMYAFSATVTNPSSSSVPLLIIGPAGTTILSYGPHSIPPGSSVVTGTFTVSGQVQLPLCLVFEITLPNFEDASGAGPVESGRQLSGSPGGAAEPKKPLPNKKCKGPLCFRELPKC